MDDAKTLSQVFISYRRDDSAGITGRIYDRLIQRFGREAVFKDVDSIPLGINFKRYIDSVIAQCGVVLVVIGDKWETISDKQGNRLLHKQQDFVRLEIESALQRDIPIIPLLVQNASMPAEDSLPPSLAELTYRNGIEIGHDPHFHTDINRLISHLEALLSSGQTSRGPEDSALSGQANITLEVPIPNTISKRRFSPSLFWVFAVLLSLLLSLALGYGAASLAILRGAHPPSPYRFFEDVPTRVFLIVSIIAFVACLFTIRSWKQNHKEL